MKAQSPDVEGVVAPDPVAERHEVPSHEKYVHVILDRIAGDTSVSQRSLAREAGIALGLTNLLLRKIVRQGWIRIVRVRPNRVRYMITPTGLSERARIYRARLAYNLEFYRETRDRIRESLDGLARSLERATPDRNADDLRIALYGAGEVAEIAVVCLQGSRMKLVAVVDDASSEQTFFGLPVHGPESLQAQTVDGTPFDHLVIMSFKDAERIRHSVVSRGVPVAAVHII